MNKFSAFDIEAKNWVEFLILGYYDGKRYKEFLKLGNFLNFLFNDKENHNMYVYAHNAGRYDFNFLFNYLFTNRYNVKFIDRKGRLLSLVVRDKNTKVKINFTDSIALLPLSLEKLSNTFGVKHLKGTINYNRLSKVDDKLKKYLKQDCVGLYTIIQEFDYYLNELYMELGGTYKRKLTIASQAWHLFNSINNEKFVQLNEMIESDFRKNHYSGGRVEVYKGYGKDLFYYDINSLYPFAMLKPMPVGNYYYAHRIEPNKIGFYKVKLMNTKELYVPPFLIKTKNGNYYCNAEKGDEVYLSSCDIENLRELGYRFKFIEGIYFAGKEKIFYDYVTKLYDKRVNENDGGMKLILKLMLNSLYGKLGSSRFQRELKFQEKESETSFNAELGLVLIDKKRNSKFILPYLAAYITSIARNELYKYLINHNPYYCDTDSIITKEKIKTGTNIGELKLESEIIKGCFALPKTYCIVEKGKRKHKSVVKGYSKKIPFNKMYTTLKRNGYLIEKKERVLSFRETLHRKKEVKHKVNQFLQLAESEKEMKLLYEKRKIKPDKNRLFDTEAYWIREIVDY